MHTNKSHNLRQMQRDPRPLHRYFCQVLRYYSKLTTEKGSVWGYDHIHVTYCYTSYRIASMPMQHHELISISTLIFSANSNSVVLHFKKNRVLLVFSLMRWTVTVDDPLVNVCLAFPLGIIDIMHLPFMDKNQATYPIAQLPVLNHPNLLQSPMFSPTTGPVSLSPCLTSRLVYAWQRWRMGIYTQDARPETNIAPENRPSQKDFSSSNIFHSIFKGCVGFRDGS